MKKEGWMKRIKLRKLGRPFFSYIEELKVFLGSDEAKDCLSHLKLKSETQFKYSTTKSYNMNSCENIVDDLAKSYNTADVGNMKNVLRSYQGGNSAIFFDYDFETKRSSLLDVLS